MRGLAAVGEDKASDRLREIVLSKQTPGPLRLEAARALGSLRDSGLENDARSLAADVSPRGIGSRLAAASILRKHRSDESIQLLLGMTRDKEPAVAAVAVARLLQIDAKLLVPELKHLLANPDANLRKFAVEVLFRLPDEDHINLLAKRLDDVHVDVRVKARRSLYQLAAKAELKDQVIAAATEMLAAEQWRGLEQAAFLLTQLDHKPSAQRLVQLLEFNRSEVLLTAAWGLRKLAVKETLPDVLKFVESQLKQRLADKGPPPDAARLEILGHALSQLNQFLGKEKYRPADTALRLFVPRQNSSGTGPESRAAAIWALGMIHEGKTDEKLATQLEERLNDTGSIPPEDARVRWTSAITLGRMKAKDALGSLELHYRDKKPSDNLVNNACGWAIERITGKPMPAPQPKKKYQSHWFLAPETRSDPR
jgi:HEAT repeat protein